MAGLLCPQPLLLLLPQPIALAFQALRAPGMLGCVQLSLQSKQLTAIINLLITFVQSHQNSGVCLFQLLCENRLIGLYKVNYSIGSTRGKK